MYIGDFSSNYWQCMILPYIGEILYSKIMHSD